MSLFSFEQCDYSFQLYAGSSCFGTVGGWSDYEGCTINVLADCQLLVGTFDIGTDYFVVNGIIYSGTTSPQELWVSEGSVMRFQRTGGESDPRFSICGSTEADGSWKALVTNCEGYITYNELPDDWCEGLTHWAICGIADGRIDGPGYGCTFSSTRTGYCKDKDGNDQCTKFLRDEVIALPTSNPTIGSTSYPTVAPVNCEGYLMYHELPSDWCENLTPWAICGIADGVIDGSGYGCEFRFDQTGWCKDKDGNDQCTQFLQESDIESEDIESEDFEWTENLSILVISLVFLLLLFWLWRISRKYKRRNQQDVAVEVRQQQRIQYGVVAVTSGMPLSQQQSGEGVVEMVEPSPGEEIANSMHPEGRPVWSSSNLQPFSPTFDAGRSSVVGENKDGEDLAPSDPAPQDYKVPPTNYQQAPPNYEAPPPYHETPSQ